MSSVPSSGGGKGKKGVHFFLPVAGSVVQVRPSCAAFYHFTMVCEVFLVFFLGYLQTFNHV